MPIMISYLWPTYKSNWEDIGLKLSKIVWLMHEYILYFRLLSYLQVPSFTSWVLIELIPHVQSRVANSLNGNIDEYYPRKMHWQKLLLFNVVAVEKAAFHQTLKLPFKSFKTHQGSGGTGSPRRHFNEVLPFFI